MGFDLDAAPCGDCVDREDRIGAIRPSGLRTDGSPSNGASVLVSTGRLPVSSEFDGFRDVLEERRSSAIAWVGGSGATAFDLDDAEALARWGTAADIIFGVIQAEGLLTKTRRRKSMLDMWERIDKRASYYRELLRTRKSEKDVTALSPADYVRRTETR